MPSKSSDNTKKRFLKAASEEFASFGIAGARTGRIAKAAGANEALLYRYFGNKQSLFTQVYESLVQQATDDVLLDPMDLGSYAGALFDYYQDHDQVLRLATYAALEAPDAPSPQILTIATAQKEAAVAAAQEVGKVSKRLPAGELLALVIQLSFAGASVSPAFGPNVDTDIRRKSIVAAAGAIAAP